MPAEPEDDEPSSASWLIPAALLLIAAAGAFAAWYFISQQNAASSISLIPTPPPTLVTTSPDQASLATPVIAEAAPAATDPTLTAIADPATAAAAEATTTPAPPPITDFAPDQPLVARSSGQRYRAEPSSADEVAVLGETRAGGETLAVNGRTMRPDGEWYRLTLSDGRTAWIKAALTVPRSNFAETFNTPSTTGLPFTAAPPRILEPAENLQLPGGPQPVRLAWSGSDLASYYIVEIETYDAQARRWVDDPLFSLETVESADELAKDFPHSGYWRWRVRGVSPGGAQTPFSRWAAFAIRD